MEELLIKKVQEHEVLYNNRSINYRDQNMRHQAWQEIAEELETTATAAKTIWDKLRRCFLNALSRRRTKKGGYSGKKMPPWKYETQMSYLLPFLDNRNTESDISGNINSIDGAEIGQEFNGPQENTVEEQKANGEAYENTKSDTISNSDEKIPSRLQTFKKTKRATCQDSLRQMVNVLKENADIRKRKFEEKEKRSDVAIADMDETDMFFISMSKMTKILPFMEQARIKKLLSNAVFDAQIKCSHNIQSHHHQSAFSSPTCSEGPSSTVYSGYSSAESTYNYTLNDATGVVEEKPILLKLTNVPILANNNINM